MENSECRVAVKRRGTSISKHPNEFNYQQEWTGQASRWQCTKVIWPLIMTAVSAVVHAVRFGHTRTHTHPHTQRNWAAAPQTTVHFELSQKRLARTQFPGSFRNQNQNQIPFPHSSQIMKSVCTLCLTLEIKFEISNFKCHSPPCSLPVPMPVPLPLPTLSRAFPNCSIRNVCNSFGLNPELKLKIFSKNCAAARRVLTTLRHVATEAQREVFGGWATEATEKEEGVGWGGCPIRGAKAAGNESDCHRQRQRQQCQSLAALAGLLAWSSLRGAGCGLQGAGQTETEAHWAKLLQLLAFVSSLQQAPAKQFKLNKRTHWTYPPSPSLHDPRRCQIYVYFIYMYVYFWKSAQVAGVGFVQHFSKIVFLDWLKVSTAYHELFGSRPTWP